LKPIALQLYTVREYAQQDLIGTLRRVADIGYSGVEFAGLHGHDPEKVAAVIDELNLKVCSSHTAMPTPENIQQLVETEQILGNKRLISGLGPDRFTTLDDCRQAIDIFRQASELLQPYNMSFGLHNHWWEFKTIDGKLIYDLIMEEAPAIFGQLDVYWAAFAGSDPVKVIKQYSARLPLLHIKDGTLKENEPHTAVGNGILDIPAIINAANPDITEWLIVELDEYSGDMWEAVQHSYDYLTSNQLVKGNR